MALWEDKITGHTVKESTKLEYSYWGYCEFCCIDDNTSNGLASNPIKIRRGIWTRHSLSHALFATIYTWSLRASTLIEIENENVLSIGEGNSSILIKLLEAFNMPVSFKQLSFSTAYDAHTTQYFLGLAGEYISLCNQLPSLQGLYYTYPT